MRRRWIQAIALTLAGAATAVGAPSGNATLKAEVKAFEKADANDSDALTLEEFLTLHAACDRHCALSLDRPR